MCRLLTDSLSLSSGRRFKLIAASWRGRGLPNRAFSHPYKSCPPPTVRANQNICSQKECSRTIFDSHSNGLYEGDNSYTTRHHFSIVQCVPKSIYIQPSMAVTQKLIKLDKFGRSGFVPLVLLHFFIKDQTDKSNRWYLIEISVTCTVKPENARPLCY